MDPRRWQRVEQVFFAVLDRPEAERAAAAADLCGDDAELRGEVERLLAADRTMASGGFLDPAPSAVAGASDAQGGDHRRGTQIGRYIVERQIGEGGMGSVLLATRAEDFRQHVAIKIIHRGLHTEQFARRFRDELQILAALAEHSNIASLHDAGTCDDGRPYFVMEYIAGERIDRYCDARQLTTRQRVELFRQVCAAVQFAHQHTVVHRDIKPGNILVDEQGTPKLIDFGIAKIVGDGIAENDATRAVTEHIALTPDYASPEQFRGEPVSTASDVYSLGVVLYELLAGRRPYNFSTRTPLDLQRAVCEQEPEAPSTAVLRDTRPHVTDRDDAGSSTTLVSDVVDPQAIGAARRTVPSRLRRQLSGDLDNIILMALRKEPERRYATVEQLSEDLRRHLAGLPVSARRDSIAYRARKFVGRNRLAVAAAVVLVVSLAAGIVGATRGMIVAQEAQQKSHRSLTQAIEAVRRMLSRVGSDRLAHVPQLGPTRREILEDALEFCESFVADNADDPAARLELGRVSYLLGVINRDLGQHEQSRAAFDRAIDVLEELAAEGDGGESESSGEALEELALSCYHASAQRRDVGQLDEAKGLLQRAIEIQTPLSRADPDDLARLQNLINTANNLSVIQIDLNRIDAAEATLDRVMQWLPPLEQSDDPGDRESAAHGHNNMGFLMRRRKRFADAEREYEAGRKLRQTLTEESPEQPWHRKELAFSYNNLGVLHGDMGDAEKSAEEFASAVRLQRQLATDFPSQPIYRQELARSLLNLAVTLRDQKFLDDSNATLDEAIALQRALVAEYAGVPGYREELARSLCEAAVNASRQGDRQRAGAALAEAREADARNPRVRVLLGRSHAASREWEAAVAEFTAALEANPDDHETYDRRGAAYRELKQYEKALDDFSQAIDLWPRDASYFRHRGSVLRDMGRLPEAVDDYGRAIELRGDYETAYNSRGLALTELGQFDRAIADFSASLEIVPGDPIVLVNRSRAYAEARRWAEAVADYSAALEVDGNDVDALNELAIAQVVSGDSTGYRETCHRLLVTARMGADEASRCVWSIVFTPETDMKRGEAVEIARQALAGDAAKSPGTIGRRHAVLGAALYRDGKFDEAAGQLAQAVAAFEASDENRRYSPVEADAQRLAALVALAMGKVAEADEFAARAARADGDASANVGDRDTGIWSVHAVSERLRAELESKLRDSSP
ncbi:MAG: protein kinase [Pirellulales bacterium]